MRLDKFLCRSTDFSRSEAIQVIHQGLISVNGHIVTDESSQVHENNRIMHHGQPLTLRAPRYIMMNKPAGTICSNTDEAWPSLFNHIELDRVRDMHVAGRLDADTTGLVLITDDGRWSFNIIRPDMQCEKVYRVKLRDPLADDAVTKFREGLQLQGEKNLTRPARLEEIGVKEVLLTITEGKYHQVKRMFAAIGNKVVALHRQQIGPIRLDTDQCQWRHLTEAEVNAFHLPPESPAGSDS